jgi:large subunit ribosomal protein L6
MSRIGKAPVSIPSGVTLAVANQKVSVKGPKGELTMPLRREIEVQVAGGQAKVAPAAKPSADERSVRAYHGMTRALIANMIVGVTKGYSKTLEIQGVGWNAQAQPKKLVLNIGFCHPIELNLPAGVAAATPNPTTVTVTGIDKQAVGEFAAIIRGVRPPEPYNGKGIRYQGEYVRRKAGKSFGS